MKLNLGCGSKKQKGFVGVDRYFCDAVEVVCDITTPLPFSSDSVEEVLLDNVIEHVPDIAALMREVVQVCAEGATITIITPHFTAWASWRDPTHVHHLSYFSMDHFESGWLAEQMEGGVSVLKRRLSFGGGVMGLLGRLVFLISPKLYEKKFCFILRASTLRFVLRVVKKKPA